MDLFVELYYFICGIYSKKSKNSFHHFQEYYFLNDEYSSKDNIFLMMNNLFQWYKLTSDMSTHYL